MLNFPIRLNTIYKLLIEELTAAPFSLSQRNYRLSIAKKKRLTGCWTKRQRTSKPELQEFYKTLLLLDADNTQQFKIVGVAKVKLIKPVVADNHCNVGIAG